MVIYSYDREEMDELSNFLQKVEIKPNEFLDTIKYIKNMENNRYWHGDIEINLASYIFCIIIVTYRDFDLVKNKVTDEYIWRNKK